MYCRSLRRLTHQNILKIKTQEASCRRRLRRQDTNPTVPPRFTFVFTSKEETGRSEGGRGRAGETREAVQSALDVGQASSANRRSAVITEGKKEG